MSEFVTHGAPPAIMLINGESKCGKTTAGDAITRWAEAHQLRASHADAGLFFRTITARALDTLGIVKPNIPLPDDELCDVLAKVVSDESIFSPANACKNPESPLVARNVSTVAQSRLAQDAGLIWFERTVEASMADEMDVVVVNGRDPRQRLQKWLTKKGFRPALDLLVQCDSYEAARRIVRGDDDVALRFQLELIEKRRQDDRERAILPFVGAAGAVAGFEPSMYGNDLDWAAEQAALSAWAAEGDCPSTIILDTNHLSLAGTQKAVAALASYSFETYTARELCTNAYS